MIQLLKNLFTSPKNSEAELLKITEFDEYDQKIKYVNKHLRWRKYKQATVMFPSFQVMVFGGIMPCDIRSDRIKIEINILGRITRAWIG